MEKVKKYIPGLLFVLAISIISMFINMQFKNIVNLEALTIAIVLGILYNNFIGTQEIFAEGVSFSLKKLLKLGIILLGFKLNIKSVIQLGPKLLIMVIIYVIVALSLAVLLGKIFKVDKHLSTLMGVGSCICGASAVVAMAPCIYAEDEDSIIAVSIVNFLGAIGVIIYSAIAVSSNFLSPMQYGVWSGLSLHGVAHAIAAAFAMGDYSGEIGTLVKMTRVVMLVPVSFILSMIFTKGKKSNNKASFPTYVLLFIVAGVLNTTGIIPEGLIEILVKASSLCILMAMASMGLSVDFKKIVNKGVRALVSGTVLFAILSTTSLFVIMNII